MSGYHCQHCGNFVASDELCNCDGSRSDWSSILDSIRDTRAFVNIECPVCTRDTYALNRLPMRLYWCEESRKYMNSCPDCYTTLVLEVTPDACV